jgi:hypothetical protein
MSGPPRLVLSPYFPFETLKPLLGADLAARQVVEWIVPALINAGLKDTCAKLINLLTMTIGKPNDNRVEYYTCRSKPEYQDMLLDLMPSVIIGREYCIEICLC